MTQEKLASKIATRVRGFGHKTNCYAWNRLSVEKAVTLALEKAAEIADRYKEPLIAEEIRKLME